MKPGRYLFAASLIFSAFLVFWIRYISPDEITWNVATYSYVGKVILSGGIPYRDAFDVKGPGIFYIFAFTMLLFGKTTLGIEILEGVWQALTALVLFRIAVRIDRRETSGYFASAFYLIYLFLFATREGTAEPDRLVVLPMSLGVLFLLEACEQDRLRRWLLAGLAMAMAALLKLPAALLGAVMLVAAFRGGSVQRARRSARAGALATGFLAPLFLCALWFYLHGGLGDLWAAQFKFAPQYLRAFSAWGSPTCLVRSFNKGVHLPLYAMTGIALVDQLTTRRKAWSWPEIVIWAWLLVAALSLFMHGLFFPYHFFPLAGPLAFLSARALAGWTEKFPVWRATMAVFLLVFLSMPVPQVPVLLYRYTAQRMRGGQPPGQNVWRDLALSIKARTTPEDAVFLWANVPQFYLDVDRKAPSRFFHSVYLATDWPGFGAHALFLVDLRAHKPKFFAVNKAGAIGGPCPFSRIDYYAAFRGFAELQQFLERDYVLEANQPRYLLYRRNDVAAAAAQRSRLGIEDDRLTVAGTSIDGVSDFHGSQAVLTGCGGCAFAGGGANE